MSCLEKYTYYHCSRNLAREEDGGFHDSTNKNSLSLVFNMSPSMLDVSQLEDLPQEINLQFSSKVRRAGTRLLREGQEFEDLTALKTDFQAIILF